MTLKSIFSIAILSLVLVACSSDPLDVDASGVKVNIDFVDVDKAFVESDSATLLAKHKEFKESIKDIYEFELGHCLGIGNVPDTAVYHTVNTFRTDPYVERLEKRIAEKFVDRTEREENILNGFRHLKYHLPNTALPEKVVYLNTMFASSAPAFEKQVGIGLERYLGKNTDVIKELPAREFYEWVKEGMDERYMERDVLASWIMANVLSEPQGGSLIETMIYWGKVNYLVEASFPKQEKDIIIRYSEEDLKWALENEHSFWKYLVDEKLLFSLDERTKMNMVGDGPFTPGLPEKGPDRLGQFLGWQMVRQYMEDHSDIPLSKLVDVSYNEILQGYESE